MKKSNNLMGNRARDLMACSIVRQQTTLKLAPSTFIKLLLMLVSVVTKCWWDDVPGKAGAPTL
jgi:hypothetical protein